ncbi:zinc-ribbon domain-containing protein [Dactylosporangium sp. McL0621]|uniref:zinc-ribbon domain-containing protein n=1 Tax=Dactylosporangium sp. McL0621 TaxID=3415678 RepID=UPI003CF7F062
MLLIFGLKTKREFLRWVAFVCRVCGQPGRAALVREVTKFSLFFVPLFPVRVRHVAECPNPACRARTKLSGEEAQRLA